MFGAWVHDMNSSDMQIFLVGIGAILWAICLNHNDVVFNKNTNIFFHAGYFQGNTLDKNMGKLPK
jgi:hypothetical protein